MEIKCDKCNKPFKTYPCFYNRSTKHYCSRKCCVEDFSYWSNIRSGTIPWNKGKNGLQISYLKGKTFEEVYGLTKAMELKKQMSKLRKGKSMPHKRMQPSYASRIRMSLSHSKDKEFHGFKNRLLKRVRITSKYLEWRANIFKRDDYHCQSCGKQGYLEAHHIIPIYKIFKEFHIKNLADAINCKMLWDLGNGISYCLECHNLLNKKGGIVYGNRFARSTTTD